VSDHLGPMFTTQGFSCGTANPFAPTANPFSACSTPVAFDARRPSQPMQGAKGQAKKPSPAPGPFAGFTSTAAPASTRAAPAFAAAPPSFNPATAVPTRAPAPAVSFAPVPTPGFPFAPAAATGPAPAVAPTFPVAKLTAPALAPAAFAPSVFAMPPPPPPSAPVAVPAAPAPAAAFPTFQGGNVSAPAPAPAALAPSTFAMPPPPPAAPVAFAAPPAPPAAAVPASLFLDDVPSDARAIVAELPRTRAGFTIAHDLATARLARGGAELAGAFALFRVANEIHVHVCGAPSRTALYNLACCMSASVGAAERAGGARGLSADARLDAAAAWLRAAVAAGFHDHAHIAADADLAPLRARRARAVEVARRMAVALALADAEAALADAKAAAERGPVAATAAGTPTTACFA